MPTLRLLKGGTNSGGHGGEVFACSYTPDGTCVLSAGWDGCLRLWDAGQGEQVSEVHVGPKPLSACAVTPDGRRWACGSMDGLLGQWDAVVHKQVSVFLAHTRPVSAIAYAADGSALATASWDRQVILWNPCREREGRILAGHADIVAGCRFTPDGKTLVSWSHDCTVRLWDVARAKLSAVLPGHADRVTAGAVCPDGRWLATGSRDGSFKLWELPGGREVQSVSLGSEVRGCFFLLDAESLVSVDAAGQLVLHGLPDLEARSELATQLSVQCGDLAPSGGQLVLGCADGRIRFVAVDGYDSAPLLVTPTQTSRHTANVFERLLGKTRVIHALQCTCPACRQSFELPGTRPGQPAPCPNCHRSLRLTSFHHTADPAKC